MLANPGNVGGPCFAEEEARIPIDTQSRARIPELDGLRGIAIVLVLLYHYTSIPPGQSQPLLLQRLFAIGWSGVDLFFVLSGFLIGGILLDACKSLNYFSVFYARRFYRIMPLYYCWVGVYFIATCFWSNPESWRAVPIYLLFLQNSFKINHAAIGTAWLGALWSLAVEEQFYLVIPLAMRLLSRSGILLLLASVLIGAPALRVLLHTYLPGHPAAPYMLTACRGDALAVGVLLAFGWRHERLKAAFYRYQTAFYVLCLVLLFLFVCLAVWKPSQYSLTMYSWGFSLVDALFGSLLIIALMVPSGYWAGICRLPLFLKLGRVSYCLYVIHSLVNLACHEIAFQSLPRFDSPRTVLISVLAAWMSYVLALCSWRLFEEPLLRRGHKLQYLESERS